MNNVFLADTRVYIAGVLFPAVDVHITNTINEVPTADITVSADSRLFNVGENDRVPVLIFQKESMVASTRYILLFEGFILGRVYMNTSIQRTITFQAIGIMDILNDMRLMYVHSLNDMYRQMSAGNTEKGTAVWTTQYFLQHGLNPEANPIDYPWEYLDNVYQFMGAPQGGENAEIIKEHSSHLAEYFWKMADIYKMRQRYLRVPLYDENSSPTTVWTGKKTNGFPILRGLQNSDSVKLLSPFLATQTPSSQTAMDLLMSVATPMDFEMNMPSSPAYMEGRLGTSILKPNFCDSLPPMCNVIFRSQVTELSQNTTFKGTPTRIQVHDINSPDAWMRQHSGGSVPDYFEMLLTIFYPQRNVPGQEVNDETYNNYATAMLNIEKYTGPWVHEVNTPAWYLWTDALKNSDEGINELGPEKAWVSTRQALAHRQLVLARYMNRTLSVRSVFNPYVAVGYPGVVFDAEETGICFAGYVAAVRHSLSPKAMETTIELVFVRTLEEAAALEIVHPIAELQQLVHDPEKMTTVYQGLLGDIPAAASVFSEGGAAADAVTPGAPQAAGANSAPLPSSPPADVNDLLARARKMAETGQYILGHKGVKRSNGRTSYDCSGFIQKALGIPETLSTANMKTVLPKYGYVWHEGTDGMQPGDVLLFQKGDSYQERSGKNFVTKAHDHGHTEIYTGGTSTIGAHTDRYPIDKQVSESTHGAGYIQRTYKGYFRKITPNTPSPQTQPVQAGQDAQQAPQQGQQAQAQAAPATPTEASRAQAASTEEQKKAAEETKKEEEKKKAEAAAGAAAPASKPATGSYNGANARTYKDILDTYGGTGFDRNSPQLNPSAAFALQRRNICSFADFLSFTGLSPVLAPGTANETVPMYLEGPYMSDRNKVKVYNWSPVQEAAAKEEEKAKEGQAQAAQGQNGDAAPADQQQQQANAPTAAEAGKAAAAAQAGTGETPAAQAQEQGKDQAQAQAQGQTPAQGAATPTVQPPAQQQQAGTGDDLGILSRKYESRGNSSAIGYDNRGGTSYGKYQIAAKTGTMNNFLKYCETRGGENGKEVARRMRASGALDTGSKGGAAPAEWQKLVSEGKMGSLEHDFIKATHYDVAMRGLNPEVQQRMSAYKTMQDVVWSTATALGPGGARAAINSVYRPGMTDEELILAIYRYRDTRYNKNQYKDAVIARHRKEERDALAMLKQEKETGSRALPDDYSGSFSGGGGGSGGGSTYTGGPLIPIRDQGNADGMFTLTEILSASSGLTEESVKQDLITVLKAVAADAFSKQIYA